jgi:hypothetical protein
LTRAGSLRTHYERATLSPRLGKNNPLDTAFYGNLALIGNSLLFDNSVPPGHNSSPSFRMKKIPVCLLVLMSKNLVRGGDFAIELS